MSRMRTEDGTKTIQMMNRWPKDDPEKEPMMTDEVPDDETKDDPKEEPDMFQRRCKR